MLYIISQLVVTKWYKCSGISECRILSDLRSYPKIIFGLIRRLYFFLLPFLLYLYFNINYSCTYYFCMSYINHFNSQANHFVTIIFICPCPKYLTGFLGGIFFWNNKNSLNKTKTHTQLDKKSKWIVFCHAPTFSTIYNKRSHLRS